MPIQPAMDRLPSIDVQYGRRVRHQTAQDKIKMDREWPNPVLLSSNSLHFAAAKFLPNPGLDVSKLLYGRILVVLG
jgi:hypothetical protein